MASYLDDVLTKPGAVAQEIRAALEEGEEEGELSVQEREEVESALERPAVGARIGKGKFVLRGEGGSGERFLTPTEGPEDLEVEENDPSLDPGEGRSGPPVELDSPADLDADARGRASAPPTEESGFDATDFRRFCEQNFTEIMGSLQSLSDRVVKLEIRMATNIPFAQLPTSPPRRAGQGASRPSSLSVPQQRRVTPPPRPAPTIDQVRDMLRANPVYPSFAGVRAAKIRALASEAGTDPPARSPLVSEWNVEGIMALFAE